MRLIYLAGPYRATTVYGITENIRRAEAVAVDLWRSGAAVICPHKNTACLDGVASDEVFLAGDLLMLERCDAVVLIAGWEKSRGAVGEALHALERSIPVFRIKEDWARLATYVRGPDNETDEARWTRNAVKQAAEELAL